MTALAFNPKNDQFFISGSLDGKIRLWNIPDKKVQFGDNLGSRALQNLKITN